MEYIILLIFSSYSLILGENIKRENHYQRPPALFQKGNSSPGIYAPAPTPWTKTTKGN